MVHSNGNRADRLQDRNRRLAKAGKCSFDLERSHRYLHPSKGRKDKATK